MNSGVLTGGGLTQLNFGLYEKSSSKNAELWTKNPFRENLGAKSKF